MARVPTNSLQRALLLLEFIGKTPGGLTNLEISREFQIPRSGIEFPVYSTAMGRALLAHLPPQQLAEFLERWPPYKRGSRMSIGKPELIADLEKVREQGYSMMPDL